MKKLFLALMLALTVSAVAPAATAPVTTVNWLKSTTNTDGSAIVGAVTYQLYVGAIGKEVKFGNPVTSPPYILNNPAPTPGTQVCVRVTATANGVESDLSDEACTMIPALKPNAPTQVKITVQ